MCEDDQAHASAEPLLPTSGEGGLHKGTLTCLDGIALGCGDIIGSGIFASPGIVLGLVAAPGASLFLWLCGGALSFLGLSCLLELSVANPSAGGIFTYLREGFGDAIAFSWQWVNCIVIVPGSVGALALTSAQYLTGLLLSAEAALGDTWQVKSVAILMVLVAGFWNTAGAHNGGTFAKIFLGNTLFAAFFVVVLASYSMLANGTDIAYDNFVSSHEEGYVHWKNTGAALTSVVWAYAGWSDLSAMAEELQDPVKTLPRVCVGTLGTITTLYLIMNAAYLLVLPATTVAASGAMGVEFAREAVRSPWAGNIMAALVTVSSFGGVFNCLFFSSRQFYATARDGLFPEVLARTTESGAPWVAVLFTAVWSCILMLPSDFGNLVNYLSFAMWLYFAAIGVLVPLSRYRKPDQVRPIRVPLSPLAPLAFSGLCLYIAQSTFISDPLSCGLSLLFVLAAFPIHYVTLAARKFHGPEDGLRPSADSVGLVQS